MELEMIPFLSPARTSVKLKWARLRQSFDDPVTRRENA
jgi:hypothetical protein